MYKPMDRQHSFLDFNQPMGLKMNPGNRWVKLADLIPWDEFEMKYASGNGLDTIRNGCWQTRYTAPGRIGVSAKNMEFVYQVQNLDGQVQMQKLIKNRSIRIIRIELKWKEHSV